MTSVPESLQEPSRTHEPVPPPRRRRSPDLRLLLAIFAGGAAGALLRAWLTEALPPGAGRFPWTVLGINVLGAVLLAHFATRLQERLPPSTYRRPLLGTGLCGALTTFSTLQVEVVDLGRDGHVLLATAYMAVSIGAGLVAVTVSTGLTRRARLR